MTYQETPVFDLTKGFVTKANIVQLYNSQRMLTYACQCGSNEFAVLRENLYKCKCGLKLSIRNFK